MNEDPQPPRPVGEPQTTRGDDPTIKYVRSTTRATWWIFAATAVAAAVGIAQWCILSGTLSQMREDQRPWVSVKGIAFREGDTKLDPKAPKFPLAFSLKNIGHLPAIVAVRAIAILEAENWETVQQEQCRSDADLSKSPFLIFPDDTFPFF